VRSISEPDINCPFSRSAVLRTAFFLIVMPPVPYQTHNEIGKFVDEQTANGYFGEMFGGITTLWAVRWRRWVEILPGSTDGVETGSDWLYAPLSAQIRLQ
jgi:hypothetical protein